MTVIRSRRLEVCVDAHPRYWRMWAVKDAAGLACGLGPVTVLWWAK